MKLSDYIIDFLVAKGVTHIFEVAGGAFTHLLDSLYGRKDIATISMHHEQAASMAAEGYARISGKIGVAMATSGPGATNLITGIGSCFFDSVPTLFITGQVNTYEFKFDKPVRQIGFQETDIVNIVKPIVKYATLVEASDRIRYYLEKASKISLSGRYGPTLLDVPLNIQRADIDESLIEPFAKNSINDSINQVNDETVKKIIDLIGVSSRPVVLAGGGIRLSNAVEELYKFIHKTGIPVVSSLMGLDAFPHNDELFAGMIGSYGNRYANLTIANSDLVLAIGTRLDTRQTGTRPETFARSAEIVHVDIDKNELNSTINANILVNSDAKIFLMKLNSFISEYNNEKFSLWKDKINEYKVKFPSFIIPARDAINPNFAIYKLSEYIPDDAIVCVDIGQVQMWSAQSFELKGTQRFLTEGGMAAMGSALPMAIGASFANPDKMVIVIAGDGGFQLNIQELETIRHHNLPIKIVLLNNYSYGMIKQFQKQYFNSRFQSTGIGYSCPNFQDVVSAYKIPSNKIKYNKEIDGAYKNLVKDKKSMFLEVDIEQGSLALPKLSVNRPVEDQEPLLSRDELKSNMLIDILPEPGKI